MDKPTYILQRSILLFTLCKLSFSFTTSSKFNCWTKSSHTNMYPSCIDEARQLSCIEQRVGRKCHRPCMGILLEFQPDIDYPVKHFTNGVYMYFVG